MTTYRWVDNDRLANTNREQVIDGVRMVVSLSPYNTPKRVSGGLTQDGNSFKIDFIYIDDEPSSPPQRYGRVQVIEGRHTGKLMSIIIPIDKRAPRVIELEVRQEAMNALKLRKQQLGGQTDRELNQSVAEEIITHDLDDLLAPG